MSNVEKNMRHPNAEKPADGTNLEKKTRQKLRASGLRGQRVVSQFAGAIMRAVLMGMLVLTPYILVPNVSMDTAQIVLILAVSAAILTFFEYWAAFPTIVEFRYAPPFNRIRFATLFTIVFLLSLVARGETYPTTATELVTALGTLIGQVIDFPYSPVRLAVLMLPENTPWSEVVALRTAAGMAYLISMLSLVIFLIALRRSDWPKQDGNFNVWVNLPTFDPTYGGGVVEKLERDARFNVTLGFLLPFLIPAIVKLGSLVFGSISLTNNQTMIWTMSAWAFLPASLLMRGIGLQRIATMISEERQRRNLGLEKGIQTA